MNPGSGYTGIPTVSVNGSGIAAGITTLGAVGIVTITSGGSGYTTTQRLYSLDLVREQLQLVVSLVGARSVQSVV